MAPSSVARGRSRAIAESSSNPNSATNSAASSRPSSTRRSARINPEAAYKSGPSTPLKDELDSVLTRTPASNLLSRGNSRRGRSLAAASRESMSSASTAYERDASVYSTPGTSAVATPAVIIDLQASGKGKGRQSTRVGSPLPGTKVNPVVRARTLRNSPYSLYPSANKRKRPLSLDDDEDELDADEDDSPDAQLARALQKEEDFAADSMTGLQFEDPAPRRTSRKLQKIMPKKEVPGSGSNEAAQVTKKIGSNPPKSRTTMEVSLNQKGSKIVYVPTMPKGEIIDSDEESDLTDLEEMIDSDEGSNLTDLDVLSSEIDDSEAESLWDSNSDAAIPSWNRRSRVTASAAKTPNSNLNKFKGKAEIPNSSAPSYSSLPSRSNAKGKNKVKVPEDELLDDKLGPKIDFSKSMDDQSELSWPDSDASSDQDLSDEELLQLRRASLATPREPARRVRNRASNMEGIKGRAARDRARLEAHHPELTTMWIELENLPKIEAAAIEQPKNINRELKPFQLEGVAWMRAMEETSWGGGLLGDEMGMGKTIQAVTLIMSDYPAKQPSLVLIPPVALMQWQSEIESYTDGTLKTFVFHGTNKSSKSMTMADLKKYDVILMSYNSLESMWRHQEKGFNRKEGMHKQKSVIHQIRFHRVILDEAHNIKQRSCGSAKACFALQADHKWCLSGTPLQNRIGEFFSLVRFLDIRPFASYFCKQCPCSKLEWSMTSMNRCTECGHSGMHHVSVFNQELLNPIQKHGNDGPGKEAFKKLRILTDRFMLRRIKRDHSSAMELPAKEIYVDRQFFGEEENDFAGSIMNNGTRRFETYVAQRVVLNNYANIFGLIMQMRQVADHPDLILKRDGEGGQNVLNCCICDETAEEAIRSVCRHDFCRECAKNYLHASESPDCPRCHIPLSIDLEQPEIEQDEQLVKKSSIINRIKMENWTSSSKIEMLVHDLHELRSHNSSTKSIIFSQFTTMLQLVEWRLRRAGITTVMLDGSMTPAQRQASINHFMTDVNVECFLVSLKAGGVALNLTEASKVFIVDPWWNPAAEWQSADRCHRIGQNRPCSVTRLCIEDSVESRMVLLQEKKTNMINSTINGDEAAMESLSIEDMGFLFRGT